MKTILLIDDDASIRTILGLSLRNHGYRVVEAASGEEGYQQARQQSPDLILTDLSMPDGDGESVLHHIRRDPDLRSRQVVLMTGNSDLTARNGMEAGADDFLIKPFSLDALLRCVEARLQRAEISGTDRPKRHVPLPPHLSHEFFTPLNGIVGLSELLIGQFENLTPEEIRDALGDVLKTGMHLHRTLRNYLMVLQFGELPATRPPEPVKPLSGEQTKKTVLSAIGQSATRTRREKDADIRVDSVALAIAPADLSIIVEELVENACAFSIAPTPVTIRLRRDGVFTVTDAGRGMTPEQIAQIGTFQQFDRKKYEQQGLGLGLVLVQHLAHRCGALFFIESTPGRGTCVTVKFPLANPPSK